MDFRINFTSGSISNVHTCVKVYTSCQFGAFFTKCTMLLHVRSTITAESNLHVVNLLDVTFDLSTGKYKPYRKPNDDPLYINKHSNHPPSILRQLPTSINKRISTLSSDAAPAYQNALGNSNFSHKLEYTPHETQRPRRNRQRNVVWFNPPFSKNVKTNIARTQFSPPSRHTLSSRPQATQNF